MISGQGCAVPRTDSIQNGIIYINKLRALLRISCESGYELRGSAVLFCNGRDWNGTLPTCRAAQTSGGYPALVQDGDRCGNNRPTVRNANLRYAHLRDTQGRLFYAVVYHCNRGFTLHPANYAVYCSGGNVVGTPPNCLGEYRLL